METPLVVWIDMTEDLSVNNIAINEKGLQCVAY